MSLPTSGPRQDKNGATELDIVCFFLLYSRAKEKKKRGKTNEMKHTRTTRWAEFYLLGVVHAVECVDVKGFTLKKGWENKVSVREEEEDKLSSSVIPPSLILRFMAEKTRAEGEIRCDSECFHWQTNKYHNSSYFCWKYVILFLSSVEVLPDDGVLGPHGGQGGKFTTLILEK